MKEKTEKNLTKLNKGKKLIHDNLWYIILAVASIITLVFFPMIGSGLPLALTLPTSAVGWIIYVFTKLAVASINIFIFHSFMSQGKLNVSDFWKKKMADEILHRVRRTKDIIPLSPEEWLAKEYKTKGITIAITSILSCIILSQVVLYFDFIIFISYLLTLCLGLFTGIIQLFKAENYWSMDYFDYAVYVMNKHNAELPPEQQLSVKNKSLYEGEILIYECE